MKKETLEEAAKQYAKQYALSTRHISHIGFEDGAKWQAERMYSEEDLKEAYMVGKHGGTTQTYYEFKEWFEQFKK
jgi:predicted esterase